MNTPRPPTRIERVLLRVIAVGALLVAALGILGGIVGTISQAADESVDVLDMQIANAETPAFTDKSNAISEARYESVAITVTDLGTEARGWLVTENLASALMIVGVGLVVAWVALRLASGRPFVQSATIGLGSAAILVAACGLLEQIAAAIARAEVVTFLGVQEVGAGGSIDDPSFEGFVAFSLNLDLAPLAWGFALAVVAGAFELGQRLQRDTEGLV